MKADSLGKFEGGDKINCKNEINLLTFSGFVVYYKYEDVSALPMPSRVKK